MTFFPQVKAGCPQVKAGFPQIKAGACIVLVIGCLLPPIDRPAVADEVLVKSTTDDQRLVRRQGEVLEYTGRQLSLRLPGGRVEEIAADRVARVTPTPSAILQSADQLRRQGRFNDALVAYRQARQQESREWVRRQIMAHETDCYAEAGQIRYAGETFLNVVRSDPTTPYFASIPLAWAQARADVDLEQAAINWTRQTDMPVARLLGASWLLGSPQRAGALEILRHLTQDADRRVALLAESQTWRTEFVSASLEEVRRWEQHIELMPHSLRAGPYFIVGRALARHQQHEDAALAYLRVPVLYSERYALAASALLQAAAQLEQAGQPRQAVTLYGEIISRYPTSDEVAVARERLERQPAAAATPATNTN